MGLPDACTQCGQTYKTCMHCGAKLIYVPRSGFGNVGSYQHLEPPREGVSSHVPHPNLHIT